LLADDDEFNLKRMREYLTKIGISITGSAKNGKETYEKYIEQVRNGRRIELVTIDFDMPSMDGWKRSLPDN